MAHLAFKVTGPEGTITKGNLPPGGLSAKKKTFRGAIPSCLPTRLCTRLPLGLPFGKTKKQIGCVCRTDVWGLARPWVPGPEHLLFAVRNRCLGFGPSFGSGPRTAVVRQNTCLGFGPPFGSGP